MGKKTYVFTEGRKYNLWSFIGDCLMFFITCGLWIIWIIIREMRYNRARGY